MCGGRGTRLDAPVEKPLLPIAGRPMVDRVAGALAESRIETTRAVASPDAPETRQHVRDDLDLPTIETPGAGYVADLDAALEEVGADGPTLTVAADLPLLAGGLVDAVLDAYADPGTEAASMAVYVPSALKRRLGASVEESWTTDGRELSPTGLNVVDPGPGAEEEHAHVSHDVRLAVNVNRVEDVELAEALL